MKKNLFRYTPILPPTIMVWVGLALIIIIMMVIALFLYKTKDDTLSLTTNDDIDDTPTLLTEIRQIGQWEFLTISDEEMIDTIRKGFFSDDELVRIYYGTLRLGIDFSNADEHWITTTPSAPTAPSASQSAPASSTPQSTPAPSASQSTPAPSVSPEVTAIAIGRNADGDSLYLDLPPIQLLDENFLDETRTKSFIEKGTWSNADRKALADRARLAMRRRCLTPQNIQQAQQNANRQLTLFLRRLLKK